MERLTSRRERSISFRKRKQGGVALLVVLGSLVFVAALILAFLSGGGSEVKTSAVYSEGSRVGLLSQTVVNLIEAELVDATKGVDSKGGDLAWASQPGMVRTYDTAGNLVKYYKLYSSASMVGTGAVDPSADLLAMKSWYQNTAYYTDLNAPVHVGGKDRYPILDGNLVKDATGAYVFPTGSQNLAPAGFKITAPPIGTPSSSSASANLAPFPVQWLYVLQDGTVTAPQGGSGTVATVPGAGTSNPIVGRIAFWADDETGKVNINTASEGIYSDTPRVDSTYDRALSDFPAARNEFARYPGHPATTSLSTVFGNLLPVPASNAITTASYKALLKPYYDFVPKVADGGSMGGTAAAAAAIAPDTDRLYASVDELMFQPSRADSTTFKPATLDQARFFVTAHSRSPDVNLFNRPRVAVWPVSSANDADHRTVFDQLVAFTSTINKVPYYFERSDWTSSKELDLDKNRSVLNYLRALCGKTIPGFGGNFAAKYSTSNGRGTEIDQILTEAFDYIRCVNLEDTSVGGSFVPFTPKQPAAGAGEVVPTYDAVTDTKGFGRFPTVVKAGVLFFAAEDPTHLTSYAVQASPLPPLWNPPGNNRVRVQAALVFQLFEPGQGYPGLYPDVVLSVAPNLSWDYGSMFNAGTLTASTTQGSVSRFWGGNLGFRLLRFFPYGGSADSTRNLGPLLTAFDKDHLTEFDDAAHNGVINFGGGTVAVTLSSKTAGASTAIQTINLTFPSGKFTVPTIPAGVPQIPLLAGKTPIQVNGANFYPNEAAYKFNQTVYTDARAEVFTISQCDVLQTMQSPTGDYRLNAARHTVSTQESPQLFVTHPDWGKQALAHSFKEPDGTDYNGSSIGLLAPVANGYWNNSKIANPTGSALLPRRYNNTNKTDFTTGNPGWTTSITPDGIPQTLNGSTAGSTASFLTGTPPGDWDNGSGNVPDGAYINRPDEGTNDSPAYFSNPKVANLLKGPQYFSPSRLMPSAAMLGSLPTGVLASTVGGSLQPWQTLLFHNDPTGKHKGAQKPMDHLFLDLFTMPIVEPYAIGEPLSTDGRINMNYQILPFTYINRDTGIRAVLKSERMLAIANKYSGIGAGVATANVYKQLDTANSGTYKNYANADLRFDIDPDETLKGFQARFAANDLFRSASEICALDLIPADTSTPKPAYGAMQAYWEAHALTGDNSREKPYADLYPRLTTKSNTFTVHLRVQALKQAGGPSASPSQWREGVDSVTAEYRGSRIVERYVDPANTAIPNYTDPNVTTPLSQFYRYRVVESKGFPQ